MSAPTPGDRRPFRQRLDDVLRRRDPAAVRAFLIGEGQWSEEQSGDTEFAMWMMIAGSPALKPLHPEAEAWLRTHGHEAEADIIGSSHKQPGATSANRPPGQRPRGGPGRDAGRPRGGPGQRHPGARPPDRSTDRDRRGR